MSENLQTINRVLDIIEEVASNPFGLGVTELASKVKLPKSTVHRITQNLCNRNFLMRNNDKYTLAHKFLAISSQYYSILDFRIVGSKYVRELCIKTNSTVHIAILNNNVAVYVEKYQPFSYTCSYSEIGKTIPLYCSSLGKILLSGFSNDDLEKFYSNLQIIPFTKTTLTIDELKNEIEMIKQSRIAYDNAEHEEETYCIGAPIKNYQGNIIAALSISSSDKKIIYGEDIKKIINEYAKKISLIFGYESE